MLTPDAHELLGIFALTKDGSQKVKDTGEVAKMAETNIP